MNQLTNVEQAQKLHEKIMESRNIVEQSLAEFAKNLKQMRDGKLYKTLGYDNFGNYTEQAVKLKRRQAYKYINVIEKLDENFVHSNAQIGITKLELLSELNKNDRNKFTKEKHNVNGKQKTVDEMTTRELDKAIKEHQELEDKIKDQEQKIKDIKENILLNQDVKDDMSVEFEEVLETGCLGGTILEYNVYFCKGKTKTKITGKIYDEEDLLFLASYFSEIDVVKQNDIISRVINKSKILIKEEKEFVIAECLKFTDIALAREEEIRREREEKTSQKWSEAFSQLLSPQSQIDDAHKIIYKKFYKTLALKFHPDQGGSNEEMIVLNQLKEQWGI